MTLPQPADLHTLDNLAWGVADGIGHLVLGQPQRMHTLTPASTQALCKAVDALLASDARAIVVSAGHRVFSAGGDIGAFTSAGDGLGDLIDELLTPLNQMLERLLTAPKPIVSLIDGPVAGGGIGLALCADFVLASEAMVLQPGYAAIGLSPDMAGSWLLARRVGPLRTQQWFMLGEAIDARQCLAAGAIDRLYPDAQSLAENGLALAQRLAASASASMASIKALMHGCEARTLAQQLRMEHRHIRANAETADCREGIAAFTEKRAPRFGQ